MLVVVVGLAGLAAAAPQFDSGKLGGTRATDIDKEQLTKTLVLIEQFLPPLMQAINDSNGDPLPRLNKLVDSSLVLGRESLLLNKSTSSNQELIKEIDAARGTMPLIMQIIQASIKTFGTDNANGGGFDFSGFTGVKH